MKVHQKQIVQVVVLANRTSVTICLLNMIGCTEEAKAKNKLGVHREAPYCS